MHITRLLMMVICGAAVAGCGASAEDRATNDPQQQYGSAGSDSFSAQQEQPMHSEYGPERQREDVAQHQEQQRQRSQAQSQLGAPQGQIGQQGQMGQQGQTGQQGQMGQQDTIGQQGQLAMRKGDENVTIGEVVFIRDRSRNRGNLVFFRDDVDCAAVTETPTGDDAFVAMVEVEPGTDGMPRTGSLPPAQWTYETGEQPRQMQGQQGWVSITRVPDTETIEGRVTVATTVQDERFELNGPFTATVCEVSATAVPTRGTRPTDQARQRGQTGQGDTRR